MDGSFFDSQIICQNAAVSIHEVLCFNSNEAAKFNIWICDLFIELSTSSLVAM